MNKNGRYSHERGRYRATRKYTQVKINIKRAEALFRYENRISKALHKTKFRVIFFFFYMKAPKYLWAQKRFDKNESILLHLKRK